MAACGSTSTPTTTGEATTETSSTAVNRKAFDGQAALTLAQQQCEFGPRVPGTSAHANCAEWLTATLRPVATP